MFVIRHGRRGRVVVHRAECALLDTDYYEAATREIANNFDDANARACEMVRPYGGTPRFCSWCRPHRSD
jgi:hypothetical protein